MVEGAPTDSTGSEKVRCFYFVPVVLSRNTDTNRTTESKPHVRVLINRSEPNRCEVCKAGVLTKECR